MRNLLSSIFILALAMGLYSCSSQDEETVANLKQIKVPEVRFVDGRPDPAILADQQILNRGNGSEPQTMDPHKAEGVPSSHVLRDLFEGLTIEAPNGDVIPGGAQSWEISDDALTYTFHIRPNMHWSNGDPVTAHDFEYGLKRSADPKTGSKYSQILAPILNVEKVIAGKVGLDQMGVKALDDATLAIKLKGPTPYFLGLLNHSSTYPVHKGNVEATGDRFSRPGNLISNGAYSLEEWVVRSHIKIKKNPHYWDADRVIITEVIYHPIEDQSTEVKRYRAGELDWTYELPNAQFKWIKDNLPAELIISPYLGVYYYGFNLTKPPFKDNLNLRKALSMAIDRETLVDKVTRFGEMANYAYVPSGIPGYEPQQVAWAKLSRDERLTEARRLYAAAGYSKTNPLTVEIRYNTSENHKKIAVAISSMWKQNLGVKAQLVNEEWKVFLENRKQKVLTQAFRAGWISDYNDAFSFLELLQSKHGINDSAYNRPEYDALLEQIAIAVDADQRRELMYAAERMMLEDQPIAPIYSYVTKRLVKPWLKGWESNVMDHNYSKNMYILKTLGPE